tara:strand:+ start:2346 stop:2471 length:126 start_codon:yes stop_codon:yes gene_type:complete
MTKLESFFQINHSELMADKGKIFSTQDQVQSDERVEQDGKR